MPKRKAGSFGRFAGAAGAREYASARSYPSAAAHTRAASSAVSAKIETQSIERHAGTTPLVLSRPHVGLSPTILLNAAATRPEPAVSVPSAKLTRPEATATADPELDPPDTYSGFTLLLQAP